jgi:predicted nucleic acid-binding protein
VNIYIDADVIARWEKGVFDFPGWIEKKHSNDTIAIPPTVWQQLLFGRFAWEPPRAAKRARYLQMIDLPIGMFTREHATRAASIAAELRGTTIGFADFQIAACAVIDGAALATFNGKHFNRVPGLQVIIPG